MIEQEDDYYGWANEQAAPLSQGQFDQLDLFTLVDEIKNLAIGEVLELEQSFEQLFHYFLMQQQAKKDLRSAITTLRRNVQRIIKRSPSIREQLTPEFLGSTWRYGAALASEELGSGSFGDKPLWNLNQLLDEKFFP